VCGCGECGSQHRWGTKSGDTRATFHRVGSVGAWTGSDVWWQTSSDLVERGVAHSIASDLFRPIVLLEAGRRKRVIGYWQQRLGPALVNGKKKALNLSIKSLTTVEPHLFKSSSATFTHSQKYVFFFGRISPQRNSKQGVAPPPAVFSFWPTGSVAFPPRFC